VARQLRVVTQSPPHQEIRENEQNDCSEEQYNRSKYLTHALAALPRCRWEFSKHKLLAACRLQRDQEQAAESVKSS